MITKPDRTAAAFSLAEMLIVITVVGFLVALSAPNIFSMLRANELSTQGDIIHNNLSLAQQTAISQNQDVEVRIFEFMDEHQAHIEPAYRALQFYQYDAQQEDPDEYENRSMNMRPITKVFRLNDPLVFSEDREFSNLLTDSEMEDLSDDGNVIKFKLEGTVPTDTVERLFGKGVKSADYVAFRFRANGSTTLPKTASGNRKGIWFMTIVDKDAVSAGALVNGAPRNFFTLQIDPYNGSIRQFRP